VLSVVNTSSYIH